MFLRVTRYEDGKEMIVNLDKVLALCASKKGGTDICFGDEETNFHVRESYDAICESLDMETVEPEIDKPDNQA